jgi:trk system potassium uptake protein TrkH
MNIYILEAIFGRLLTSYGFVVLLPLLVALYYREDTVWAFAVTILILLFFGLIMRHYGRLEGKVGLREGIAAVAGAWLLASLLGALPFCISGVIPNYIDAVFETASGLTTTGASVLTGLELLPRSVLFWRSLTQWLGGMGIIVLFIVLLPNIGMGAVHLFNAEVSGADSEKVLPKIKDTALVLWTIYAGLTLLLAFLLILAGMPLFDAVNHAFTTLATGGFSTRTASVQAYDSIAIELIIVFFMFFAAVNFNIFIHAWRHRTLKSFNNPSLKLFH